MAKIIHFNNTLENGIEELKNKSRIWLLATIICFILFLPTRGLTFPIFIFTSIMYNKYAKPLKLKKIGLKGEKKITKVLDKLPDSYTVISNLNLNISDKITILDSLVIGPNGLFVIKTKSLNGKIVGDSDHKYLTQHKVGRGGGSYSKEFFNPLKQVNTQIYNLSSLLKSTNLNEKIQGVVYFSNSDCKVKVNSIEIPVFSQSASGSTELINFITNYNGNNIPLEKQEAIIRILTSYNTNNSEETNSASNNNLAEATNNNLNSSYEDVKYINVENSSDIDTQIKS